MARRNRRQGGARGRNRGNSGVFARPIVEPANFLETSIRVTGTASAGGIINITWAGIGASIARACGITGTFQASKLRISSVLVDTAMAYSPTTGTSGSDYLANIGTPDCTFQMSGNHYTPSDITKPLRIKFKAGQGSDGEWKRGFTYNTSTNTVNFLNGYGQPAIDEDVFGTLQFDPGVGLAAGTTVTSDVRFRIAFTDDATGVAGS